MSYFSSDLTWRAHVEFIISKASKRIFVVHQLVRSGLSAGDVISVYISLIRSILENAYPVWHCGIPKDQSEEIEGVQRRCLRIVYPELSYSVALHIAGLEQLRVRRERLVHNLFNEMKSSNHVLNNRLPLRSSDNGI